jgi:hypothetical protein
MQCCPDIIPALTVQPKIRCITKYFGKHQSRVHRDRPFVVTDFVNRSAADAHRFGQLTLGNSQRRHKLFNEHLTNAYRLSFGHYHIITSLITVVIEINTVSLASVIIP